MKSLFADLFKQNVAVEQEFDAITIGLASPEKMRSWSYGEVKSPRQSITGRLNRNGMGYSAQKIFDPSKIMSVSVVSTSA